MKRAISICCAMLAVCLLASDTNADSQPPKRAMNFIAVMDLRCGKDIEKDVCSALTEVVIDELVKIGKYTVIDRANRDKILSEVGFQQTGCVDESCTIEVGRILGVGKMVVGSITKIGTTYLSNLQLLNVETATVEISASEECACELGGLIKSVRIAAGRLMGQAPSPSTPVAQPPPEPTKPSINVEEMILIPAGEFIMGSDSGRASERPAHTVYLDEYYIDKYEVTNAQYEKCEKFGACPPNKKYPGFIDPLQPVVGVNLNHAQKYCSWAAKRLPTEAEWEKAARGTDGRTYPWGEGINCSHANYADCGLRITKPVGSYPLGASPYGVMDMTGNVREWVSDLYDKKYYQTSPSRNPRGPTSGSYMTLNIFRGGDYTSYDLYATTYYRTDYGWSLINSNLGFRCAKTH